mmetsp:Transcript_11550/g.28694  ORF Transcript_11550/g.28694 Transcript_11550/m.28694 type:complete len:85 (+) Transcript_11550:144-398(+)
MGDSPWERLKKELAESLPKELPYTAFVNHPNGIVGYRSLYKVEVDGSKMTIALQWEKACPNPVTIKAREEEAIMERVLDRVRRG